VNDRKRRFAQLAERTRLENGEIASRVGRSLRSVAAWRAPSDVRQPPEEALERLERVYLEILRQDAAAAGFELTRIRS
jgi:hypothetical protein